MYDANNLEAEITRKKDESGQQTRQLCYRDDRVKNIKFDFTCQIKDQKIRKCPR